MRNMFYGAVKPIFQRAEELRKNPTHEELLLWQYLKANQLGVRFKRQHPIWMYIADFYCHELKLVIEVDGSIHNVKEIMENDIVREEDIKSFEIKVVRFTNSEIRKNIESVIDKIRMIITELKTIEKMKNTRIHRVFESPPLGGFRGQGRGVLNIYCTAGYPQLNSTIEVMNALQENGADIIELGMPYSDPLADGPVIQASNAKALQNGMTISKLFDQLKGFRNKPPLGGLGVLLMGYMNPVLQYGFEKFCKDAAEAGVDGLILPDLPAHEFETEYGAIIKKHGLDFIFLVTPETSEERVRKLDQLSSGFLYAVSSSSTTGSDNTMSNVKAYLQRLKKMHLQNPVLVGFGIKDRSTFETACTYADGAIIGSAYIKALEQAGDVKAATKSFLSSISG